MHAATSIATPSPASTRTRKAPYPVLNSREQDLMLMAKGHYPTVGIGTRAEAARLIVGIHNLHDPQQMTWQDTAYVVAGDLERAGLLAKLQGSRLCDFLIRLAPASKGSLTGHDHSGPGGYFEALIEHLLSVASIAQVRDGDRWLLNIETAAADPAVFEYLSDQVAP